MNKATIKKFDQLIKETTTAYKILKAVQARLDAFTPEEIDEVNERKLHGFSEFAEFSCSIDDAIDEIDFWVSDND